jgi:hypothetical protein
MNPCTNRPEAQHQLVNPCTNHPEAYTSPVNPCTNGQNIDLNHIISGNLALFLTPLSRSTY